MLVKEKSLESAPALNWKPFVSLLVMTGAFTSIILGLAQLVKAVNPLLSTDNHLNFGILGIALLRSLDARLENSRQGLARTTADIVSLESQISKSWDHEAE